MKRLHTTEKPDDLQPVLTICEQSSLKKIVQKAKFLLGLDRFMQTLLPETFTSYVQVMNVTDGVMILGVTSASIATRIRFMSGDFILALQKQKEFAHIQTIHCRVCAEKA